MSGLAAGIRLAYFDKHVLIVERHEQFGGLNSFYRLDGRSFDVGLHAVTNYVPPGARQAPLPKLLRQLRLSRDDFDLHPQTYSEIRFPGRRLRFSNDFSLLLEEVSREFPDRIDGFRRLVAQVRDFDDTRLDRPWLSTRAVLSECLGDSALTDMLLCPLMYYGSAEERDMDFTQFVILFKSIFLEGLARPGGGVRRVISALVRKYRSCGGRVKMGCGVERLVVAGRRVTGVMLQTGETLTAETVLSSAGFVETMGLCNDADRQGPPDSPGRLSFLESICILDRPPAEIGLSPTIVFFNDAERFDYARPEEPVDVRSGVICCPNNFVGGDAAESVLRFTSLADFDYWFAQPQDEYAAGKRAWHERVVAAALRFIPDFRHHVVYTDTFTPRTIRRYTGHVNGAVYGCPTKRRDGRTRLENLLLIGTDQGYLGIIGALISGITMANMHVLGAE